MTDRSSVQRPTHCLLGCQLAAAGRGTCVVIVRRHFRLEERYALLSALLAQVAQAQAGPWPCCMGVLPCILGKAKVLLPSPP